MEGFVSRSISAFICEFLNKIYQSILVDLLGTHLFAYILQLSHKFICKFSKPRRAPPSVPFFKFSIQPYFFLCSETAFYSLYSEYNPCFGAPIHYILVISFKSAIYMLFQPSKHHISVIFSIRFLL